MMMCQDDDAQRNIVGAAENNEQWWNNISREVGKLKPTSEIMAAVAATAAEDKQASDVVALDVKKLTIIADYFIIAGAETSLQVRAIAQAIEEALADKGIKYLRREGWDDARWVLLDYADIVVHIFLKSEREFYALERLWGDADKLSTHDINELAST